MFEKTLKFFIQNSRINYALFVLIFIVGIYSYYKTPKEIFPSFDLDAIAINGHYQGSSIDTLDKMAVQKIEDELKDIDGIKEMTTIITPSKFNIILLLNKGVNRYNTLNSVKDALSIAKQNLPTDMDDPSATVIKMGKNLLKIAITSKSLPTSSLIKKAKELKEKILNIKDISKVKIYGDSELYFDIVLNPKKIKAYNLNQSQITQAISRLSYIFPIGKIEDEEKGSYFISTYNGKKSAKELQNTKIKIANKSFYLKDIATISKHYKDSSTHFLLDDQNAIGVVVEQGESGNAIDISKEIKNIITKLNQNSQNISYMIYNDQSEKIKDRLNIVISNILLGIILISLLVALLINVRMAIIIVIGIPTSFVLGALYFYLTGYTINMISLVGVLIAIGILVDDAIVVSENIQQHIESGLTPKKAALVGAKEMFLPVTIASLTTLFAFIPALMISGSLGEVIKLIPIAVSVLVIASLVESFLFLPIHSAHILNKNTKTLSWQKANKIYNTTIHFCIKYKKTFLLCFIIIIPFLTFLSIKMSKFQMFPKFDSSHVEIVLKAKIGSTNKQTLKILQTIQKDLFKNREKFAISHISSVAGWRRDSAGNSETYPYVGSISIEFEKLKPQNFIDRYITPNLSFYYDKSGRVREEKSEIIAQKLREFLKEKDYKNRFSLVDLSIVETKAGPIKSDIKIGLISDDNQKIINSMKKIKNALLNLNGVVSVNDGIKEGIGEIKLKITPYGESLGLDEQSLGTILSDLYLQKIKAVSFNQDGLINIEIKSIQKDSLNSLKNFEITLSNDLTVKLKDVVEFKTVKSFEKVIKDFGERHFYIYANVDTKILTANDALQKIDNTLKTVQKDGVKLIFKGEKEKQKDLKNDMIAATTLSLILIMLSLLYLFNSFRETFMMMSVIPFSFLGVMIGHHLMGLNLSMPTLIGALGLAGIVINDGIIMIMSLKQAKNIQEIYIYAAKRFRPIVLTSITTLVGLSSLIFFPTGQATIFQPMAIALGFGLAWGTVLNLLYLPTLYTFLNFKKLKR